jgi:hypothetical protein
MEYIYVGRNENQKIILDYKKIFESKTLDELVEDYNKQTRLGIVGVHLQVLYLIAMRAEFKERLKESPVYLLEYVLGLVGEIEIVNRHIRILK